MLHSLLNGLRFKALALTLCISLITLSASAGLDTYSIYLNNKLVLKQAVNQPLNLNGLKLEKANANDRLVIYYSECTAPNKIGSGRRIAVKNDKGEIIKEWKFADVTGTDKGMEITVKELLELKKHVNGTLTLVYAATRLPGGQPLTGLQFG